MERPTFNQIWTQHDELGREAPRDMVWGLNAVKSEADEWHDEHHDPTSQEFLYEGADVVIAWMTAMKGAGISMEVALQAIWEKTNIIYDRLIDARILSQGGAMTFDDAYNQVKELER